MLIFKDKTRGNSHLYECQLGIAEGFGVVVCC